MADSQIGSTIGLCARPISPLIANITADGANTVTVTEWRRLRLNQHVDIRTKATGAVVAADRTITGLTNAGVVTYSGADVAATVAEGLYPVGEWAAGPRSIANGGTSARRGFDLGAQTDTIEDLRQRLIDVNPSYYTTVLLNGLSYNDLVYAVRLVDEAASI
jgi:hypothetical protein